jgi:MFS transporter, AAHS family, 4-hydroxybenzoate transporter
MPFSGGVDRKISTTEGNVVEDDHRRISVTRLIDIQNLNGFSLRVIAISFLVVVVEGYDIAAMAFAAPGLLKAWHISNPAALGPVFSASIVGMMIGSGLFGYLGDRFGRRNLIINACIVFGLFTGLVLFASTLEQLFVLRLLAGIGLGGAAPNAIALTSEFAPSRRRALATLNLLAPNSVHGVSAGQLVVQDEPVPASVGVTQLFRNGLAGITVLYWIAVIGNFMTYFFLLNWTPALLSMAHLPPAIASLSQAVFQIGGVIGGIVLGYALDKRGPVVMASFSVFAIVPTIATGFVGSSSPAILLAAELVAGFCILGTAYGFGAIAAMIYPTWIRSNGAGWGLGAGRLGSIVSTVAAGELAAAGVGLSNLFLLAAVPLLVCGAACFALARRRTASLRSIGETLGGSSVPLSKPTLSA